MIKGCKICGIKDSDTLNYIINHPYPPKFIGFICNYPKSSRYVELNSLNKLLNVKKNKCKFVAVLVKPNNKILEEIKYFLATDITEIDNSNILVIGDHVDFKTKKTHFLSPFCRGHTV